MKKIILVVFVLFLLNVVLSHDHQRRDHSNRSWNGRRHHRNEDSNTQSSGWYSERNRDHRNHHRVDENSNSDSELPTTNWNNGEQSSSDFSASTWFNWYGSSSSNYNSSSSSQGFSSYDWSSWYYPSSSSFESNDYSVGISFVIVFSLVSLLFIITSFTCNGGSSIKGQYIPVTQL